MSNQLVEAVLFARYNASNFKALYGRLRDSTTYTKDYFQIPESVSAKLKPVLGGSGDRVEVEYVWPGGSQHGHFHWSTDRYHLKWETDTPPRPWKLGQVGVDPFASLPGDPSKRTEAAGDAQLAAIEQSGTKPWLVAIKLAGEGNRLHLRVYFENPPAGLSDRGLSQLPKKLRDEISKLPANSGTGFVDWSGNMQAPLQRTRATKLVEEIQAALARDPNVLLVGPPGTGKSVALEDLRQLYSQHASPGSPTFDATTWSGGWGVTDGAEARSECLVFHPSYTYENFVAGLFPKSAGGGIELEAKAGPLLCLAHWVGKSERKALLVLDEFNRGPAAAIFGDTLSLLDKDKRCGKDVLGSHMQRPYPSQDMPVPASYRRDAAQAEQIEAEVRLPAGVHIVAAMNSTDRSVAPLDAAMRRRFTVIRVGPDYDALAVNLLQDPSRAKQPLPSTLDVAQWTPDDVGALAVQLLQAINLRIEYCLGEDFLLGHALVWDVAADSATNALERLARSVDSKLLPTLRMTFIDQDEALAAVLGIAEDAQVNPGQTGPDSVVAYWRTAPASLAAIAPRRLMLNSLHLKTAGQQLAALAAMARQ